MPRCMRTGRTNNTTKRETGKMSSTSNRVCVRTALGEVEISSAAIVSVVTEAVLETYGVVGMASSGPLDGLSEWFHRDTSRPRGVVVRVEENEVKVDVYVILESGLRLSEVANNIIANVRFALERFLGLADSQVRIHVQAVRDVVEGESVSPED